MSKLEELLEDYCPDGVEYKPLKEIAQYGKERVDSSEINSETYVGVDNLLPNKTGKVDSSYVPSEGRLIKFYKDDILIGNIRPYLKKIWLSTCDGGTNGDVLDIHIKNLEQISSKYLFYVLSSDDFFFYDMQYAKGAKMPRGNKDAVMQYEIPVPPLPVQQEIVRILDMFTGLTAELTAELTARKKQYEYYRDQMLTFDGNENSSLIGDVCNISAGGDIPKNSLALEKDEKHTVPIISNGIGENAIYGYTDKAKIKGEAVTVAARGTIGYAEYRNYDYYPIVRLITLQTKDTNILNTKFLYYSLQGRKYRIPTSGIPQLTVPKLKKEQIYIPTMNVQLRIVNILDHFDTLCSDISDGLPAEIEARQKQYEYYRDKLLTFKRKA